MPGQPATLLWAGAVTPDYFQIMRIPLLAGRRFTEADGEKSAKVALVSAATAKQFWPGENPIGKYIRVRLGARAENRGGRCGRCPPIRSGRQVAEFYQRRLLYAIPAVNQHGSEIALGHDFDPAHGGERAATRRTSQ